MIKMGRCVVLCLMVKNEEKVVLRLLESCKNVFNSISLTDTGSTDQTCQLVKDWAKSNNVSCIIFNEPWINFGVSRTKSIINSKKAFPDASYFLLLDGDMILKPQEDFDPDSLILNEYLIMQNNFGNHYYNTRLVDAKRFFRSVGGTHEYWSCPSGKNIQGKCNSLIIDDMNDGGSRCDKHIRDKKIMLEGLRKGVTPDYLIGRYYFYLAQTYQGIGNYRLSNFWYKKRIKHGGWEQEIYYSYYQICENYFRMKNYKKAIYYSFKAWDFRPSRAESILVLTKSFKCLDMKNATKYFCELGKQIPKSSDILFLDTGVYDGSKFDEILKN